MHRPWGKVLFHWQSFCWEMNAMNLEKPFGFGFHACFQNVRIIWVYVMASGFGILFYRGANIPITSRLVLRPRDFQLLLLSSTYVNGHILKLTLYTISFNCSFVGRSVGFLKTWPSVFSGLKAVLMARENPKAYESIPYITGVSEHVRRILTVTFKPVVRTAFKPVVCLGK